MHSNDSPMTPDHSWTHSRPEPGTGLDGLAHVVRYTGAAASRGDWLADHSAAMLDTLQAQGAVLLRGLDLTEPGTFDAAVNAIAPGSADYRGGTSPRTRLQDGVYTSTEYPKEYEISLHNEMSYSVAPPDLVFFCCAVAPVDRGETPVADCRRVLQRIPPDVVAEYRERGLRYERRLFGRKSSYNSWAKAFETEDPQVVEDHCAKSDIAYEWLPNDGLRIRERRDALRAEPRTGAPVWFNQANLWHYTNSPLAASLTKSSEEHLPMNVYFGDGGSLDRAGLDAIRAAYAAEKRCFAWQQGDLLAVDNRLVAHGRMPFSGPRRIMVAMRFLAPAASSSSLLSAPAP